MKKSVLILLLAVFGCAHLGPHYAPTSKVDLYRYPGQVPPPYVEMGEFGNKGGYFKTEEGMLEDLKQEAMDLGADGIIKIQMEHYTEYTELSIAPKKVLRGIFIKYKKNIPGDSVATK